MVEGKNPKAVRAEIMERLDVSENAKEQIGIKTALPWTSAFKPTTRTWHASRSGRIYSREDVRAFYATNGNRFRCYCVQTECLLDANSQPILTKSLQSAMANERKRWGATKSLISLMHTWCIDLHRF
ncbi:hypothetical protein ABID77_000570 [Variovorax sp. PvP013]